MGDTDAVELFIGEGAAHVFLHDDVIDDATARRVTTEILAANADVTSTAPVVLHINCRGGNMTPGYAIMHAMRTSRRPVTALVEGYAMSMAAILALAGIERVMAPDAVVLFHEMTIGDADRLGDVSMFVDQMHVMQEGINGFILSRTRFTKAELARLMRRDRMLDAAACVKYGVVDRVLGRGRPPASASASPSPRSARSPRSPAAPVRAPAVYYSYCPAAEGTGEAFAEFDAFMRAAHRDPKPLLLHFGTQCEHTPRMVEQMAWLGRIHASRVPVNGVVDGPVSISEALPFLACDRRTMYGTGSILVRRLEEPARGDPTVADVVDNTALLARLVRAQLRKAGRRVPAAVLAALDKDAYLITPRDALRWGIVDEVVN